MIYITTSKGPCINTYLIEQNVWAVLLTKNIFFSFFTEKGGQDSLTLVTNMHIIHYNQAPKTQFKHRTDKNCEMKI